MSKGLVLEYEMSAWQGSLSVLRPVVALERGERVSLAQRLGTVANALAALLLLVLVAPLLGACILLIKLASPGPAVIRQKRLGQNGMVFDLYKLRTMRQNAEAKCGPVFAAPNDDRIIPVCRWMRISHVDELPQLVNVLKGEMALIGPRPERPEIAEQIYRSLPEFRQRLGIKPGITGLAQVCYGYNASIDAAKHKLKYDLEYIRRRSWRLDLWILAKTTTKLHDATAR